MAPVVLKNWGKRTSKYGNRRVKTAAGVSFDSESEHRRWQELQLLERAGEIRNLKLHPIYDLCVNGHHCADYIADFYYEGRTVVAIGPKDEEGEIWMSIVEDRKAGNVTQTPVFRLKRELMYAIYGIHVLITGEKS